MDYVSPNNLRAKFKKGASLDHAPSLYDEDDYDQLINELANALEYCLYLLNTEPHTKQEQKALEESINQSMYTPIFAKELIALARDVVNGEV